MKKLKRRSDTFNPLDTINRNSSRAPDDCKSIAKAMVVRPEEAGKNEHFYARAEARIAGMIATTAYFGVREVGTRSLVQVANLLSSPEAMKDAMTLMQQNPGIWGGGLARMGGQMSFGATEELASVSGTVTTAIDFMNTPEVANNLESSTFDPSALCQGKMTVYLVLPPEFMRSHSALMRLWISSLVGLVIRGGLNKRHPTNFIIDEAGSGVGHMDCLGDVLNIGRGYSAKLQLYYQDYGQLERCWPRGAAQGLLANTTSIAFGVNDYQTAEMLAKRCGNQTVIVESGGSNSGYSRGMTIARDESSNRNYSRGSNSSWQQQQRQLLTPDEIMALPPRIALTFLPGMRPVYTTLLRYYEEKKLIRYRWLRGVRAACRTFIGSAMLLVMAAFLAYVVTKFVNKGVKYGGQPGGETFQNGNAEPWQRSR